jgi:pimeloyl-ACP methyl ester carboxylesterase
MLNYQIIGDGPPLLLLHGFGISFNIWIELRLRLRDHFTLVTVELPGIGSSPLPPPARPYLAAAVDALDSLRDFLAIPRWRVIGYSSGSRVAEAYLQSHTEHVERAVFLCPAVTAPFKAAGLRAAIRFDAKFPQLGNWVLSGARLRFLIRLLGFNLRPSDKLSTWFNEITSQPMDILKETLRSIPEGGARPFAVPEEIPSLFVWGREDIITATPRKPSARDVILRANHSMPQTKAREVADVILHFL